MKYTFLAALLLIIVSSCSRRVIPLDPKENTDNVGTPARGEKETVIVSAPVVEIKKDSLAPPPPAPPVKPIVTTPNVITVSDASAKKSIDGRLYYDLQGKRYWKNYKDGKFYLFDKSMTGNPDFKPRN